MIIEFMVYLFGLVRVRVGFLVVDEGIKVVVVPLGGLTNYFQVFVGRLLQVGVVMNERVVPMVIVWSFVIAVFCEYMVKWGVE